MPDIDKTLAGLTTIKVFFENKADMMAGEGKRLMLHWANVARDAAELIEAAPTVGRKPLQPSWLRGKPYCSACGKHLPKICKEKQGLCFCPWCGRAVKWECG